MAGLVELLASYVPAVVQRRFRQDPRPLLAPEVHRCRGSLLFLDISGFSALTESLAGEGREGTEKLTRILNAYFDRLIATVIEHGGDVVKLAGDSVVALWEADADYGVAGAVMRAAECGLATRQSAAAAAADCGHHLELRAAIGAGDIGTMFLGGESARWELLLVGDPVVQIAGAARAALPGQLVVPRDAWSFLEGRFSGRPLDDGHVEVTAATRPLGAQAAPAPVLQDDSQQALLAHLPEGVKARLLAGQSGWLAELRRVSVVFVNLPDWDQSALAALKRTQLVMSSLQKIVYQFEGSINKLSVDDKGVTLLVVLGLPPLAHEDDAVRAVRCALAVQWKLRELSVRSAIGVATGHVFSGSVGNDRRREYTVIGGVVNLAARLMQSAPGDVLCDEATKAAAGGHIRFETLSPLKIKGRAAPTVVYRPFSRAIADRAERPMFGRAVELQALLARLDALTIGTSAAVGIEAEAGMGKSLLVAELVREAANRSLPAYLAGGSSIERATPFHAWRPVFNRVFGLDEGGEALDPGTARRAVLEQMPDAEARRLAPLLNGVLPIDLPETELTSGMEGATRAQNTHELLLRILESDARRAPLLIVVEDLHWMDSASLAFAAFAARRLRPALFVLTTRPLVEPVASAHRELVGLCDAVHKLEPLDQRDTGRLIAQRLGVRSVPAAIERLIVSRTQGHPFFTEQLALALRDTGVMRIEGGECVVPPEVSLDAVTLPDSVERVVTGRMDRLSPGQQLTLKVASVIGRVFAFRILRDVHPIEPDRPRLPEYLAVFAQADLTALEPSEPDLSYVFKQAITHEVAYNLMLFTQRRQLHKAVAEWYSATFALDTRPYYAVLAHHYKRAEEPAPALRFADLAGREAMRHGAYREAIEFLNDALAFDAQVADPQPRAARLRRARWESALADAYIGLGDVPNSRVHTVNALALLGAPAPASRVAQVGAIVTQACRQWVHAWRPASFQHATREARERAEAAALACERLGHLCYFDADLPMGLYAAIRCVNLAEQSGAPAALGRAYADMAMALMVLGFKAGSERYCQKAEGLADRTDDRAARAWTHQLAGIYASSMGQFERSRRHLRQAIAIAEEVRDFRRQEESTIQHTLVSYQSADFHDSLRLAQTVRELAHRRGHQQEHLWSTQLVALSLTRLGRVEEASDTANAVSLQQIQQLGRTEQVFQYGVHALCHVRAGRHALAARTAELGLAALMRAHPLVTFDIEGSASVIEACIELAAAAQDAAARSRFLTMADQAMPYLRAAARVFPVGAPRCEVWRGVFAEMNGQHRSAAASFDRAIERASAINTRYEAGLAHLYLARMSGDLPDGKRHAAEASRIFSEVEARFDLARAQGS